MTLEQILPEIRKGRRGRRKGWRDFWKPVVSYEFVLTTVDLLADDWELEPEEIKYVKTKKDFEKALGITE